LSSYELDIGEDEIDGVELIDDWIRVQRYGMGRRDMGYDGLNYDTDENDEADYRVEEDQLVNDEDEGASIKDEEADDEDEEESIKDEEEILEESIKN